MELTVWMLGTVSEDFDMTLTAHASYADAEQALIENFLPDYADKGDLIDVAALMTEHNPTVMWGIDNAKVALALTVAGA